TVGRRVIVIGGFRGTGGAEPGILASTDGRAWRQIGVLGVPVRYAASVRVGQRIWLFGGERDGQMQTAIQEIDPRSGRSRVVGQLPAPLGHASAAVAGRRIL